MPNWTHIVELWTSWNCKKVNICMANQQCNRHLHFPGQPYSFHRFFQTFPYLWPFLRLFKALKIFTLNSKTFPTFPGSVRTLLYAHWLNSCWLACVYRWTNCGLHRLLSAELWSTTRRRDGTDIGNNYREDGNCDALPLEGRSTSRQ